MATFNVTTTVNVDTLSGRTGGDILNINGGDVTMDEDSRYGLNGATNASWATIALSASLGGNLRLRTTGVRLIYFDSGSGNVPAYNTTISQGSASGLLIGVYSALNVAPTTPGSAMPTAGYIKIKQWNSVAFTSGALTGIGASCTTDPITGVAADRQGWIEILGDDAGTITMNRLNNSSVDLADGGYMQIGTTDGNAATTYQIPSNGVNQYHGGVFVETATPGEYEYYSVTSDTATSDRVATNERKGKHCWISTAGVVTFGNDGTNTTGGYVPPAGRKIRIPSIFMVSCATASRTQNNLNSSQTSRFRFVTTSAGVVRMTGVSCVWSTAALSNCAFVSLIDSGFVGRIQITNAATSAVVTRVGFGQPITEGNSIFVLSACLEGATINDLWVGRGAWNGSNNYAFFTVNSLDVTVNNLHVWATGAVTGSHYSVYINSSSNVTIDGGSICGRIWWNIATNVTMSNFKWWAVSYQSNTANGDNILLAGTSINCICENIDVADGDMPSGVAFLVQTSSDNVKIRNLATYADPVDTGLPAFTNASISRSTTTITVTATGHGLRTGQNIFVWQNGNLAGVTHGAKVVTVIDANTFTFTGTNSGATSGVISYVPTQQTSIVTVTNSTNIKIQNINANGTRSVLYTANNTNKNIYIENIPARDNPYLQGGTAGAANLRLDSTFNGYNVGATQSAVYGSHFVSVWNYELTTPLTVNGASYSRSSGTITVTSADHGLITSTFITVKDSSNNNAGTLVGRTRSITVVDKDTFLYTGSASGATSGTIDYQVPDSKIILQMNEPNDETTSLFTVNSGSPLFTGGGTWSALVAGDQATWEMERFIIGFTGIPATLPWWTLGGGNELNYRLEYDIDRGSGFSGSFKNWFYPRTGGAITSGSPTMTMTDTTGLQAGDYIFQPGVPKNTTVLSVDNGTTITMSANAVESLSSQTPIFNYAPNEATFPSTGVKFKVRITLLNASTQPISFVYMPLTSDATSRATLYPQDVETVTFSLTGLPTGTTVALYDSTDTELQRNDNITSGSFTYNYIHSGSDIEDVYYVIWHEDYIPFKSTPFDLTATDLGLSYTPVDDTVYDAAYTDRYTIDYANKRIIMDTGETTYDVRGAYSKWKDNIFLADNFTYDFAFEVLGNVVYDSPKRVPPFTSLINNWKIRPDEANHTLTVSGGILYVDGGGDPFVDTLGAYTVRINYVQPVEVLMIATGSGVTPSDVTDIANAVQTELNDDFAALPTAAENADAVWDEVLSGKAARSRLADADDNAELASVK